MNKITEQHPVKRRLCCTTHLTKFKHHSFPGLNLWKEGISSLDVSDTYKEIPFSIGPPLPYESGATIHEDVALPLVRDKYRWEQLIVRWEKLGRNFAKSRKNAFQNIKNSVQSGDSVSKLPYSLIRLTELSASDPDKHFSGNYNLYYGNTLASSTVYDKRMLYYPSGDNMNKLYCSTWETQSSNSVMELIPTFGIKLPEDGPIYDIITGKNGLVSVRQRDACSFFMSECSNEEFYLTKSLTLRRNEFPFIAMDVNNHDLCTIDMNRTVQIWNPEYSRKLTRSFHLQKSDKFVENGFVQIKYDRNAELSSFVVLDNIYAYYYDERVNPMPVINWNICDHTEYCEISSLLLPSKISNYWYIGTTHCCLMLDIRKGFVEKWTHMLPQGPTVGTVEVVNKTSHRRTEMIVMSSQSTDDAVAIFNNWTSGSENPIPKYFPRSVPSRVQMLHSAQMNGLLTSCSLSEKYLQCPLIGLLSYKYKKRMGIISLLSSGIILHQSINKQERTAKRKRELDDSELEIISSWDSYSRTATFAAQKKLRATKIADMSNVLDVIDLDTEPNTTWPKQNISGPAVWKLSKREMESHVDMLAHQLIYDMGLDDESDWESDRSEEEEASSIGKVSNWLFSKTVDQTASSALDMDVLEEFNQHFLDS